MGADLIVGAVEMPKGKTPDWAAARAMCAQLTDAEAVVAVLSAGYGEWSEDDMPDDVDAEAARDAVLTALDECEEGWLGFRRNMVSLSLAANDILIAAEMSWGDLPEGVQSINLFVDSGAAEVAGFVV
jgi:hypothetical protein